MQAVTKGLVGKKKKKKRQKTINNPHFEHVVLSSEVFWFFTGWWWFVEVIEVVKIISASWHFKLAGKCAQLFAGTNYEFDLDREWDGDLEREGVREAGDRDLVDERELLLRERERERSLMEDLERDRERESRAGE